jgi:hypothetical protein
MGAGKSWRVYLNAAMLAMATGMSPSRLLLATDKRLREEIDKWQDGEEMNIIIKRSSRSSRRNSSRSSRSSMQIRTLVQSTMTRRKVHCR